MKPDFAKRFQGAAEAIRFIAGQIEAGKALNSILNEEISREKWDKFDAETFEGFRETFETLRKATKGEPNIDVEKRMAGATDAVVLIATRLQESEDFDSAVSEDLDRDFWSELDDERFTGLYEVFDQLQRMRDKWHE